MGRSRLPDELPHGIAEQKHYKTMYEGLLYGDPKMRILRILWTTIYNDHKQAKHTVTGSGGYTTQVSGRHVLGGY